MSLAKAYGRAFFEAARDAKVSDQQFDQIEAQLDQLVHVMNTSTEVRTAFLSPAVSAKEKISAVEKIAEKMATPAVFGNFLKLLVKKDRMAQLPEIRTAISSARLEAQGGVVGQVISAEPLAQADLDGLASAFQQKLGKRVVFRASTDENLLAGVKVTVGGVTYDGTLRSQLQRLRDRLMQGAEQ